MQTCLGVHRLLQSGEFSDCSDVLKSYTRSCFALFPLATTFKPAQPPDIYKELPSRELQNEPLASNNIDDELSTATEQRLGLE